MSIVEIRATVNHRYYMRKTKDEIITRIQDMSVVLDRLDQTYPVKARYSRQYLINNCDKHSLSDLAMKMHDAFP